jgi:Glycosyltransferase family 87
MLIFWTAYIAHQTSLLRYAYRTDFLGIYVGAHEAATGHGNELYDLDRQRATMNEAVLPYHRAPLMAFIYPAYVAILLSPIGALSFEHAVVVLLSINALIALRMAWLVATRFTNSDNDRLALLFALLAFVPLHLTLLQNQLGLFPALGILEAMVAFRDRRPVRAGCWVLLGILKPQLILLPLLALLVARCWKALTPFLVGALGGFVISLFVAGWWVPRYLSFLVTYNRTGWGVSLYPQAMQNWRGLAYVLFYPGHPLASRVLLGVLSVISVAAVIMICGRSTKRAKGNGFYPHREAAFAIAVLLGVLTSPHEYLHDWIVFVPAAAVLQQWWRSLPVQSGWRQWTFSWLLAGSPFILVYSHFIGWSPNGLIQWVPWYMGSLAVLAILALKRAEVEQDRLYLSDGSTSNPHWAS